MRIAVLADIHGNRIALERCLHHAEENGAQAYWFLGDYLGEMAFPQRTMALLYAWQQEHECAFIRGNKEEYWLGALDDAHWRRGDSTTGVLWYARENITQQDKDFFRSLPIARIMTLPGLPPVTICHGSPRSVKECLVPAGDTALEAMEAAATPLILCGHRHRQDVLEHAGRRAVNPGAVGVPLGSGGKACYMLLDGENGTWHETMLQLDYDVERTIAELHESQLDEIAPAWTRMTCAILRGGAFSQASVLRRAMELCTQHEGQCVWPHIPEYCWDMACREKGI